jgi:hypothetical protein
MGTKVVTFRLETPQEIAARIAEDAYVRVLREWRTTKKSIEGLLADACAARDRILAMGDAQPPIFADRRQFPPKEDNYME